MKLFFYPVYLLLVLFTWQCRVSSPAVSIISKEGQGLLNIAATGFGEMQNKSEQEARQLVLQRLIFDGIPNDKVADARLPLVPNRSQLTAAQQRAVNELTAAPYSDRFFLAMAKDGAGAARASNLKKSRGFVLQVNYDLLRRDLESRNVIRKFGL